MRVGIDIGGTSVKLGFVDNYKIIYKEEIKTNKDTLFIDIKNKINEIKNKYNYQIEGLGFGVPGNVKDNYIFKMPNVGLENINLNELFKEYKISSSNDANVAALAEDIYQNKYNSLYFITLGTGVGGGLVLNHKIFEGNDNCAGEIGHIIIDDKYNFQCTCGLKGCLETISSATGIVRLTKTLSNKYETKINLNNFSCKDVFDYAKENDPLATKVIDEATKALAKALAMIAVSVNPEAIFIGGGVSKAGDYLINKIRSYFKEYSHYGVKMTEINLAHLSNDAGILGAAYLW